MCAVHVQFMRIWKVKDGVDNCYGSCICVTVRLVADLAAKHGVMPALRNRTVRLLLRFIAHADNAALILLCLMTLRQVSADKSSKTGAQD